MSQLNWKGKPYRPVGGTGFIKVYQPDINELMKPLSQKRGLGSAMLTGNAINPQNNVVPDVTASPTPSVTPSLTPTQTITPTNTSTVTPTNTETPTNTPTITPTNTPSSTPVLDCYWNTNDDNWNEDSTLWNDCVNVPTPTPSPTQTNTPSVSPTNTLTPTPSVTVTQTNTPSPTPFDSAAVAYLNAIVNAGGTTDATISAATNTFFSTLRSNGFLTQTIAMYPFVGSTSASHVINANDPGVNNGTFSGGWTFNSSGSTPNGTNASFSMGLATSQVQNYTMGVYVNQPVTSNGCMIGAYDGSIDLSQIFYSASTNTILNAVNTTFATYRITTSQSQGFFAVSRLDGSQVVLKQNTSGTTTSQTFAANSRELRVAARNSDGTINEYFNKRIAFVYLGSGYSDSQLTTLYNAIQTYQTSLARQV